MDYEIHKTLVASTGHITAEDNDQLIHDADSNSFANLIVYCLDNFGHIIFIPEIEDPDTKDTIAEVYSHPLRKLMEITRQQGCNYLRVDCDGPIYENLPTFEW